MSSLLQLNLQNLDLKTPTSSSGSYYFTKLVVDKNEELKFNLPNGNLKKAISVMKRGDSYMNFNFESQSSNENNDVCLVLQNIEDKMVDVLFQKSSEWFENEISHEDIRDCLFGFLKFEKSGKEASLKIKVNLNKNNNSEILLQGGKTVSIDELNDAKLFSPLVCISGIKFNSKSFYINMELCDFEIVNSEILNVSEDDKITMSVESEQQEQNNENETKTIDYEDNSENIETEEEQTPKPDDGDNLIIEEKNETIEDEPENETEPEAQPEVEKKNDLVINVEEETETPKVDIEEIEIDSENLEENINFDESKNVLKLNENRILFYKLYMLFNEQIKTHQVDSILGKLGNMDVSYDKFIDFINNEEEVFLNEEKFTLN